MQRTRSWILTDVTQDIYLDQLSIGPDAVGSAGGWSIRKRRLHGGLREGVDVVEIDNGALKLSVLPTRGMGIWKGSYKGMPLEWKAPIRGPVHPHFVDLDDRGGIGWLTGFDELVCRCGLASNAGPGEDVHTDRQGRERKAKLTLHGRIANLPAMFVEARVSLDEPHEITLTGQVEEGGLFYPHFLLTTHLTTAPGSNRIVVHDIVQNLGSEPAEMQMLYHCNFGPPFLEPGSRLALASREMAPQTPRAAEGIPTHDSFGPPQPGFAEQVYCHEALSDAHGKSAAMLYSAHSDKGVALRWATKQLPCFTLWKNTGALEDGYVAGLEPGTNFPNFKGFERKQGRVPVLSAGGRWEATWSIEVLSSPQEVARVLAEIVALQSQAKSVIHTAPHPRFSAVG